MVLAPQRMPTRASSTLSRGRYRTVFWGTVTCSRSGAKKHRRRRYSPRAHRLARPVWRMVDFVMAHSFQKGIWSIVLPLIGNIPLAGVRFRDLSAPLAVLLH